MKSKVKIISFLTSDGGAGKSSCSHLLALGAVWSELEAAVLHTDLVDPPIITSRPYHFFDCRDLNFCKEQAEKIYNSDMHGLCVIDGGANREGSDQWIASLSDLVCIPVKLDAGSVKHALKTAETVAEVNNNYVFVIVGQSKVDGKKDAELLERLGGERVVASWVQACRGVRELVEDDPKEGFITPETRTNNTARSLFRMLSTCW